MSTSNYITLNNGISIPQIGFGCWKVNKETCAQQVYDAIKCGYRLFDGAMDYGNEKEVGEGINRALKEKIVKREELVVVSKLWNSYHHPENVPKALNRVLTDLNLDYLDIFYIHFPIAQKFIPFEKKYPTGFYCGENGWEFENVPLASTWAAMEELVGKGLIKSLGISNFTGPLIDDLLRGCKIRPQLLQIEHHPYLVQPRLVEWVQSQGIQITGYSTFGPQSFVELDHPSVSLCVPLFENPVIMKIAERHAVSPGKVLLRWATQRNILVIPKSNKKERLVSNLSVNDFDLTDAEISEISGLDMNLRFNDPWDWCKIPLYI